MSANDILERVWEAAVPRITSIQSSLGQSKPNEEHVVRVGQLDAEILDNELAHVLQEPISKALSLISHTLKARIDPELNLVLRLFLYKLSVWDSGGSYGAKLQDLRYVVPQARNRTLARTFFALPPLSLQWAQGLDEIPASGLSRITLLYHSSLSILLPYLHSRLRTHCLSQAWPDAPSSDRRRRAWDALIFMESLHALCSLVNFVAFLWNGRYRTLADRLLHMRLVPLRNQLKRDISYEFMNRQMVWHAFTEFLLFLLPLIHTRSVRRRVYQISARLSPSNIVAILPLSVRSRLGFLDSYDAASAPNKRGRFYHLPVQQCAICAENASFSLNISEQANIFTTLTTQPLPDEGSSDHEPLQYPINVPYVASCGDIYCYSCIAERLIRAADEIDDKQHWECLRCAEKVTSAYRYEVEVTEMESGSDYDFSSDTEFDATDMSGSMGSYSESDK